MQETYVSLRETQELSCLNFLKKSNYLCIILTHE